MKNLSNYIVHCLVQDIKWNEQGQPYEQTINGRIMLSLKKDSVLNSYNSKN